MSLTKVTYSMIQGAVVNALDYGLSETNTAAANTTALQAAVTASGGNGGHGTVFVPKGTYDINTTSFIGILGLTLKGDNGGNAGNLASGSTGGASVLNFTNATGNSLTFTSDTYNSANILFEDIAIFANTTGYAVAFTNNVATVKQTSQIYFNRVSVTNAGGASAPFGNGIRFSGCFYVFAEKLFVRKTGTLYTVGTGITIDMGGFTSFLGGEFNFNNCSI